MRPLRPLSMPCSCGDSFHMVLSFLTLSHSHNQQVVLVRALCGQPFAIIIINRRRRPSSKFQHRCRISLLYKMSNPRLHQPLSIVRRRRISTMVQSKPILARVPCRAWHSPPHRLSTRAMPTLAPVAQHHSVRQPGMAMAKLRQGWSLRQTECIQISFRLYLHCQFRTYVATESSTQAMR